MANTKYTGSCKKKYIVLTIISWLVCFGICGFLIIKALSGKAPATDTGESLKTKLGTILYSTGVSALILAVLSIIVKDKIEPTIWMGNIILSGYLYSMTVVYIVFAIWLLDNYVIKGLKNRYKQKYLINKEIDRRE